MEEELTHSRQVKQSMRSRLILVERQNNRMSEENAELSANVTRLEQHNAQLKADITKVIELAKYLIIWLNIDPSARRFKTIGLVETEGRFVG